jgi:hypothetical protein
MLLIKCRLTFKCSSGVFAPGDRFYALDEFRGRYAMVDGRLKPVGTFTRCNSGEQDGVEWTMPLSHITVTHGESKGMS